MDPLADIKEIGNIISKHLYDFYNDIEHKSETPTCVICVAFFLGLQFSESNHTDGCCPE